jgi:hypothetical protein
LIAVNTFIGILIAFASTYLCIRRYLKMSLDDLY